MFEIELPQRSAPTICRPLRREHLCKSRRAVQRHGQRFLVDEEQVVNQLADRFVKNPAEVVKVGDRLKVHVLEVDLQRRRIGLSARTQRAGAPQQGAKQERQPPRQQHKDTGGGFRNNPFSDRFNKR